MHKKYILSIDGGSQSTKVSILDLEGHILSSGIQKLKPCISPRPGYVEHPDDDLWFSLCAAVKSALKNFKGSPEEIIGVGLCTIRSCRAFLKSDGSLAYPVISWMDPRTCGPFIFPTKDIAYATTTTGYMTVRLTGEFKDTIANCPSRQWPTDMHHWRWSADPNLFEQFNVDRNMMLNAQMPGTILGYITRPASYDTGLPAGLPVIATANDKAVEALGAGLLHDEQTILISLGTYITSMLCGNHYLEPSEAFWTNFSCIPGKYLYESAGIFRGMWTVSWLKELLGEEIHLKAVSQNISSEDYLNKMAEKIPAGCDGLMTVLNWLGDYFHPYRKGIMLGFDSRHTAAHMYRSILEGIALTMKNNCSKLCNQLNINPKRLIISGGGANSDIFMQIFSDVFGIQVIRNQINNAVAIGSAACVAVALGIYENFEQSVENMVHIQDSFYPNQSNFSLYTRINNQIYQKIVSATDDLLENSSKIFH